MANTTRAALSLIQAKCLQHQQQQGVRFASTFHWPRPVYIRGTGAFLPNDPVPNDDIDEHLGSVNEDYARMGRFVLRKNKIVNRHYAMRLGKPTHLGVDLAVAASKNAFENAQVPMESVDMIAAASSIPDVMVPGFANVLHGKLGISKPSLDCLSSSGVCISSLNALKAAAHAVALGEHERALVVGSESISHVMSGDRFQGIDLRKSHGGEEGGDGMINAAFLRYMLSDGACGAVLDTSPHPTQLSFRLEGFQHFSFADTFPPGMLLGARTNGKPLTVGSTWKTLSRADKDDGAYEQELHELLMLQQNIELVSKLIVSTGKTAMEYSKEGGVIGSVDKIDWILPHISSYQFLPEFEDAVWDLLQIPKDRIWTNLGQVGNVGTASPLLLLWGAMNNAIDGINGSTSMLKKGDVVLLVAPESGHLSYHFVLLRVCDKEG